MHSFIDIKGDGQTILMAMAEFEIELEKCQNTNVKIIKILHGYGSHGQGGLIKKELHRKLRGLLKNNKISNFIPCEKWISSSTDRKTIYDLAPELMADKDLKNSNSGLTIVVLR